MSASDEPYTALLIAHLVVAARRSGQAITVAQGVDLALTLQRKWLGDPNAPLRDTLIEIGSTIFKLPEDTFAGLVDQAAIQLGRLEPARSEPSVLPLVASPERGDSIPTRQPLPDEAAAISPPPPQAQPRQPTDPEPKAPVAPPAPAPPPRAPTARRTASAPLLQDGVLTIRLARPKPLERQPYALPRDDEYLPVTRRQMQQLWRSLALPVRTGPPAELDLPATLRRAADQGFFDRPVLRPAYQSRSELLLLADSGGSMGPYAVLSERLAETARQSGRFARVVVRFMRNGPYLPKSRSWSESLVYREPLLLTPETLGAALGELRSPYAVALIVSDAGAARGHFNQERLEKAQGWLKALRGRVRRLAWLNPMPGEYWRMSTAFEVAALVPMFGFDLSGLQSTIRALRGLPVARRPLL